MVRGSANAEYRRPEQDEAQSRAQQALKRQPDEESDIHREIFRRQLADEVDDEEEDLSDEEEVVVEQVDPTQNAKRP